MTVVQQRHSSNCKVCYAQGMLHTAGTLLTCKRQTLPVAPAHVALPKPQSTTSAVTLPTLLCTAGPGAGIVKKLGLSLVTAGTDSEPDRYMDGSDAGGFVGSSALHSNNGCIRSDGGRGRRRPAKHSVHMHSCNA